MPKRPGGGTGTGDGECWGGKEGRGTALPLAGGGSSCGPGSSAEPPRCGALPERLGHHRAGGLMVWGWWGRVGKERERRGEPPPGWSGGMRSPGARRGDRALSPVLEPRRQKWLRVGARCWSWASSVPQPPPRSLLVHGTGGFGGARQPPLGGLMEQPHRLSGNRFPAWAPWPIKC